MTRVGIVGTGYTVGIAKLHIGAYKRIKNVKIAAVYDIISGRAEDYITKNQLSDAVACNSYEELLSMVDAVSICTPNSTHVELSVQAIKAGKHVLCEKPFADTGDACMPAVKYAELSQRVCMIGLCYRGNPAFRYMKKLIDEGSLGDIFFLRQSQGGNRIANSDVKLEWRMQKDLSGPGAIADFGSHMLDVADWILRDQCGAISEVHCMEEIFIPKRAAIGSGIPSEVTNGDTAVFNARCKSGALLSFTASRLGCNHSLEVFGSGGCVAYNEKDPFSITFHKKDLNGGYVGEPEVIQVPEDLYMVDADTPKIPFQINFYLQNKEFIDAIEKGEQVKTDFRRGLYIQRLIDAVQLSADTGQTVAIDFE